MTNQLTKLKKRLLEDTKLKCVDGRWSAGDGITLPEKLLVTGFTRGLQCWKDGELLDELDERDGELPSVTELNQQIPEQEWETGLDGKPRPPWSIVYVIHLLSMEEDLESFTFINSTWGAQIAYEKLTKKLKMMTRLRGTGVTAIVKLDCRPMPTKKAGIKLRPEFTILEWRDLAPEKNKQPTQLPPPTDSVAAPTEKEKQETENESSPREDSPSSQPAAATTAKPPVEKKKKLTIGKPVEPPTAEEELNDGLPEFI